MFDSFETIWNIYKEFVNEKATNAAAAFSKREWPVFFKELSHMLIAMLVPIIGIILLFLAVYQWWKTLLVLIMIPILVASYRANHPKDDDDGDEDKTAYDRASELYPIMLNFMFKVLVSASSVTVIDCKHDVRDIKVTSPTGENFSLKNDVAIYPVEVDIGGEITIEEADKLRDELQRIVGNYISEFPQLISSDFSRLSKRKAKGLNPVEILAVNPLGQRIHIDVVQTTEASISTINACRKARAKRKNTSPQPPRYIDPDYGDD